jgi:hypothetical protein
VEGQIEEMREKWRKVGVGTKLDTAETLVEVAILFSEIAESHATLDVLEEQSALDAASLNIKAAEITRVERVVEEVHDAMEDALENAKRENGGSGLVWADDVRRWRNDLESALSPEQVRAVDSPLSVT